MKKTKLFLIIAAISLSVLLLCSCSRDSMRSAGNNVRNTTRRAENYLDNGLNSVENGVENGLGTIIGRDGYGANSGYSGNAGIGTGYTYNGRTISNGNANRGMVNTNRGSADNGTR